MVRTKEELMQYALQMAQDGLGRCAPNPSVGCVIVKDGKILAAERTADSGRPHAETQALQAAADAGFDVHGAEVFVTLEPCSHHGQTAPCAEALVKAGVSKVHIAQIDPDPRVIGKGAKMLADAGIAVDVGLCGAQAEELNRGFFKRVSHGLPFVTVKVATDAEGRYLPAEKGAPQWVTSKRSRDYVHLLRSRADAILTTSSTVLADNPQLTCRLSGLEDFSPQRVIIDRHLRVPKTAALFKNPPLWVFTAKEVENEAFGVKYFKNYNVQPSWVFSILAKEGKNNLLVEAGPEFVAALLKTGLVDELLWFKSPQKISKRKPMFFAENALNGFVEVRREKIGEDELLTLRPKTN